MLTKVKTSSEIEAMRFGGRVLSKVLKKVSTQLYPDMSSAEIDEIALKELSKHKVEPAFLGFQGFPSSICVSVNDEIVHGIPTKEKIIKEGDIVSLDLGVKHRGMIVDGAISVLVGNSLEPNDRRKKLLEATQKSLKQGISTIRSGCYVGDISYAIQQSLLGDGLGIVRELVGHGVGHELHEDPSIPNFGEKNTGMKLVSGMTIAVEPMATLGQGDMKIDKDGWTVRTKDGSLSAQFEHTILVTDSGSEILTSS